jgi:hypothetical protein
VIKLESGSLAIAKDEIQGNRFYKYPVRYVVTLKPGQHSLYYRLSFPGITRLDGDGKVIVPQPDDWQGALETGKRKLVIISNAESDQKPAVPVDVEGDWGEAVEGLAVRLRAKGATTAKRVTLLADARNDGPGTYSGTRSTHGCWLKVDGKWYGRVQTRETVAPMLLKTGDRQLAFTRLRLSSKKSPLWRGGFITRNGQAPSLGAREIHQAEPLELSPGRHTVRLAFPASRKTYAYSNAIEIEILPTDSDVKTVSTGT